MPGQAFAWLPVGKWRRVSRLIVIGALPFSTAPAFADTAATIEVKSDIRFRGRSLSGGNPVLQVDASIDSRTGIYGGGQIITTLAGTDRAGVLGGIGYLGYAARLNDRVTVDVGTTSYAYTRRYSGNRDDFYTEFYAGATVNRVSAYVHYTPNYFNQSVPVVYADLSIVQPIGSAFTLKAHAGLLTQTSGPARLGGRWTRYDTRLALSRSIRTFEAELAWTFAGPDDAYFDDPWSGRSAVTIALSKHF